MRARPTDRVTWALPGVAVSPAGGPGIAAGVADAMFDTTSGTLPATSQK